MTPVWRNKAQLLIVLARMRDWYAKGFTDAQVSAAIRQIQFQTGRES